MAKKKRNKYGIGKQLPLHTFTFEITTPQGVSEIEVDAPTQHEAILDLVREYPEMVGWRLLSN